MNKNLIIICIMAVILSSCASTRDIVINNNRSQLEQNLIELETAIVPIEASIDAGRNAASRQTEISSARQMITRMERESTADADYSGKLNAWSGRLFLLEGRNNDAQRLHRQSVAASTANIPAVILSIRLERDPTRRMQMIDRELALSGQSGIGELNVERGRALTDLNRFSEAAGAFDVAFSSGLNNIYSESYMSARNRAWELRNTSGVAAATLNTLGRETISWNDCITIAKNETQLFRFITGGRTITDAELFSRLVERGFIPNIQDINIINWPAASPRADEVVTRAGAAWFIWHLYAEARADRGLLSRYSARYATGANPRSPILDIPLRSPFFDSVLGCVETEFISLPDGRNFRPTQPMRGTELLVILRRIDN